jgi:nitroreductase
MVIAFGKDGYPEMKSFERYGWRGCWRCEHCLAACPTGAISIFGKKAEDSLPPPPPEIGNYMERLVTNRRSCRRYLDQNVDPQIISRILSAMACAPTGGNSCNVEYTVIDDKERVKVIHDLAYANMEEAAKHHVYTSSFSDFYYTKMKQSEKTVRKDDLLFCGAPHLFIAHEKCSGKWAEDSKVNCNLATAYFELLANAFGLGTVIMSYPSDVLRELAPEAEKLLGVPFDHYHKLMVGFGYPEIPYVRGVQKDRRNKTHRYTEET